MAVQLNQTVHREPIRDGWLGGIMVKASDFRYQD